MPRLPRPPTLRASLLATYRARRRSSQAIARAEAVQARSDTRDWAQARRDRTRHLIELGGLLSKAGLVELVDDDRATLFGALLELATRLREGDGAGEGGATPAQLRARWRHAGLRAFNLEREAEAAAAAQAAQARAEGSRQTPGDLTALPSPAAPQP